MTKYEVWSTDVNVFLMINLYMKALSGYFLQDPPSYTSVAVPPRFGLLDKWNWDSLRARISELNAEAPVDVSYKLFFLGRHGQGTHNLGPIKYGHRAWDECVAISVSPLF